jgi:hypothetical protein
MGGGTYLLIIGLEPLPMLSPSGGEAVSTPLKN